MSSLPSRSLDHPWPNKTEEPVPYTHHSPRAPKRRRTAQPDPNPAPQDQPPPSPSPAPTQLPQSSSSSSLALSTRQVIADQAQVARARQQCQVFSGNDVFSCFPTAGTSIPQGEWASFVWNSRRPELTQTNLVDIFLFRGDSQQQILHFHNVVNPSDQSGLIRARVNDTWFGADGLKFNNRNVTFPFYWVIIRSDKTLDGNQVAQPIFSAVQTTVLDSVASASAAAAASSSSAAAASSLASLTATSGANSPSGNVQRASSGNSFPRWAIAVIVVLGFLAIAALCILVFLILRRLRKRRERENSARNSMGSSSPMMPRGSTTHSHGHSHYGGGAPGTTHSHDGASTISGDGAGALFSGADAAIMADAFRKMLRKPEFPVGGVEEGGHGPTRAGHEVLSRELAEEGRDIRSVASSRGVRVEHGDS
ncbi:hypothetical protein BJ165DRAFT_1358148 [Panaeolus papilionaceus]|nr:hypothetical protein BJ165DRAFT_1358148 [Panaeolus papilionaceus]